MSPSIRRSHCDPTAGDSLLTLAFEVLARELRTYQNRLQYIVLQFSPKHRWQSAWSLAKWPISKQEDAARKESRESSQYNAIGSETMGTLLTLEAISRRKTGALLRAPLRMSFFFARASKMCIDALDCYGRRHRFGFSNHRRSSLTSKAKTRNWANGWARIPDLGKLTYPKFLGVDGSRRRAREFSRGSQFSD